MNNTPNEQATQPKKEYTTKYSVGDTVIYCGVRYTDFACAIGIIKHVGPYHYDVWFDSHMAHMNCVESELTTIEREHHD